MKRSRFEEILEECLCAHLEGRRSIEDSLSLYPGLAAELEPLLHTAADIADGLRNLTPPSYAQEQAKLRFLAAASERERARALTSRIAGFGPAPARGRIRNRALLASAIAASVLILALTTSLLVVNGGGSGDDERGANPETVASASPRPDLVLSVSGARQHLDQVREKAKRGAVEAADIQALADATNRLAQIDDPHDLGDEGQQQLARVIQDQYALLQQLTQAPSPSSAQQIQQIQNVLGLTKALADGWDIAVPVSTAASGTPTPTAAPETVTPTPAQPSATAATPPATPAPSSDVSPTPQKAANPGSP